MTKSKGIAPVEGCDWSEADWDLRDGQRKEDAWNHLAAELKKRHSWRGLIRLAEAGEADAVARLLTAIYWLVADPEKTDWPNELRGYMLHGLQLVLDEGASMDKAFSMTKSRRGQSRSVDKELRDSQLARAVRYREVCKKMESLEEACADVAKTWTEFPRGTGVVGEDSVNKAYRRYYKTNRKARKEI